LKEKGRRSVELIQECGEYLAYLFSPKVIKVIKHFGVENSIEGCLWKMTFVLKEASN